MKVKFLQGLFIIALDRVVSVGEVETLDKALANELLAAGFAEAVVEEKKPTPKKQVKVVEE